MDEIVMVVKGVLDGRTSQRIDEQIFDGPVPKISREAQETREMLEGRRLLRPHSYRPSRCTDMTMESGARMGG